MKLYVKDIVREPNDTLYTFLYKVLNLNKDVFGKCYVNDTYIDPKFKNLQCIKHRHRSFDDIVLISKTYFKISKKIVAKVIIKFLNNDQSLSLVLCDSAKKWVFYSGLTKHESLKYCAKYNKGHLKLNDSYDGIHSYNDILMLAGLEKENIDE